MAVLRAPVRYSFVQTALVNESPRADGLPGGDISRSSNRDATPDDLDGIKPDVLEGQAHGGRKLRLLFRPAMFCRAN